MAFLARELSVLAYANGFTHWHYRTASDDMLAPSYFDSAQEMLREGDLIVANTAHGNVPGIINLVVTKVDDSSVTVARV